MPGKIVGSNLIRGLNGDGFMHEVFEAITKHQANGHVVTVDYKPMLDKTNQLLYIAFITVRE